MTRFDIRVRRKQFTQSRIERHKNYQSLLNKHYEQSKRKTRGTMVLVFVLILIIAIILAFFHESQKPETPAPEEPVSELKMDKTIKTSNQKVYRL
jgi:hypothetical protein